MQEQPVYTNIAKPALVCAQVPAAMGDCDGQLCTARKIASCDAI